jgi:hypothetical protein
LGLPGLIWMAPVEPRLQAGAMLAVLLAVISASLAFVGGGSRHETNGNIRLLNMALRNTQETDLDLGTSGLSVGDSFVVCGDVSGTSSGSA